MLNTLNDFILRVETLTDIADAVKVFETECSNYLQGSIYLFADDDEPDLFRAAMHNLGFDSY
jgi:hypothetical protein